MKLVDALVNILQTNRICVPHWAASVWRKAVTIDVDDVDIHGAHGEAFIEDTRALVDERIYTTIDDLVLRDFPLRDTSLC